MSVRYRRIGYSGSRGFVLLGLLVILTLGTLYFYLGHLTPYTIAALRQHKTERALTQATEALLGYAATYRDRQAAQDADSSGTDDAAMYGYLPLPDFGESNNLNAVLANQPCITEGCAKINPAGLAANVVVIGRFPWKTLGSGLLQDGVNECLWYAVTASHREISPSTTVMNWDTLASPDLTIGSRLADLSTINDHDRPVAVIFAPDPIFSAGGHPTSSEASLCGGGYDASRYINPAALNGQTSITVKSDRLFDTLRNGAETTPLNRTPNFVQDLNLMLDRITECANREIAAGIITSNGKVDDACSITLEEFGPRGYFANYRDQVFIAKCPGCSVTIDDLPVTSCTGTLVFSNQRGTKADGSRQFRRTPAEQSDPSNYLEGVNLASIPVGNPLYTYAGQSKIRRVPTQSRSQDIVRCLTGTAGFSTVGQLAAYAIATNTITLGKTWVVTQPAALQNTYYGCAWRNEVKRTNSGMRSYFTFRILDAGFSGSATEGFTFSIVDADNNGTNVCGAAGQHLGYSGDNTTTPFITPPKISVEFDPRREAAFNPASTNTLRNGRNDPAYTGGHVALTYWGGETSIATGTSAPCAAPRVNVGGLCYLLPEEDDNIHNWPGASGTRTGFPSPPTNPTAPASAPAVPPDAPVGVYKLDPSLSSVPANQDFHVRVELNRTLATKTLPAVRVATTANLDLASPGATIDGVDLNTGDRVLVKDQTLSAQNGVYLWNGASAAMTRATDADSIAELFLREDPLLPQGSTARQVSWGVEVMEGASYEGTVWIQTNVYETSASPAPVLNTTPVVWKAYGPTSATGATAQVRVATTSNINLSAPGSTINTLTLASNDRVLVKNQVLPSENGVYLWVDGSNPMLRASDVNLHAATVHVAYDGRDWYQQTSNPDIGTDPIVWVTISAIDQPTVRVASTATVNKLSPGSTIDGIPLKQGDRVLLKDQSTATENGIYSWNGATSALTRTTDADSSVELAGLIVRVLEGATNADRLWRQQATNLSMDVDAQYWSRPTVKVSASSDIDIASPGTRIDNILMSSGDRVLLRGQTVTAQNGVYVWNGSAAAMTRASDATSAGQLNGIAVQVEQGTEATAWWKYDGSNWVRLSVKVAEQAPMPAQIALDLSKTVIAIDDIALANNDRVLIKAQSDKSKNGIYVWSSATQKLTRATDADSSAELAGLLTQVLSGSDAGRAFRQSALGSSDTVGGAPIQWSAQNGTPRFKMKVWILPDSNTTRNQINAMKDTTRPMNILYANFPPHLRDTPVIPYPFRNTRLGFTIGQRTSATDQTISITNPYTTWLD